MKRRIIVSTSNSVAWLILFSSCLTQTSGQDSNWWQTTRVVPTEYYALKTDLPREQALELAKHMDATCESYVQTFSKLPVRVKRPATLGLFLFEEQDDYVGTLRRHFRTNATGSWGMCITRGKTISLAGYRGKHSTEEMKPLLQHEGFHQFASMLFPDMPKWAGEGMAEVFERGVIVGGSLVLGDIPRADRDALSKAISQQKTLNVGQLLRIEPKLWNQHVVSGNARIQYLQAWSLVQYFLFAENGRHRQKFLGFLVQLNSNTDWEEAFVSTFGWVDLRQLQKGWLTYCEQMQTTDLRQSVREVEYLAAGMKHLRSINVFPSNATELKAALSDADFQHTSDLYDKSVSLSPTLDILANVEPSSNAAEPEEQIDLIFRDSRGRKPSASYQRRKSPAPLGIRTQGLQPQDLEISWVRRGKTYSYRIGPARPSNR